MSEPEPAGWRAVCPSAELLEHGDAAGFDLAPLPGETTPSERGFVVRHDGQPRAYVNRCSHIPVELDWMPGKVFDLSGEFLVCSVHGAEYHPEDGLCLGGPCQGRGLTQLPVREQEGQVWVNIQPTSRMKHE